MGTNEFLLTECRVPINEDGGASALDLRVSVESRVTLLLWLDVCNHVSGLSMLVVTVSLRDPVKSSSLLKLAEFYVVVRGATGHAGAFPHVRRNWMKFSVSSPARAFARVFYYTKRSLSSLTFIFSQYTFLSSRLN